MNCLHRYPKIVVKNGRFHLPFGFVLPGSSVFVMNGPSRCLLLLRSNEWSHVRDKLLGMSIPSDAQRAGELAHLKRLLVGTSREILVSGRGVIELDEELADYAGIQGRILWVPAVCGVELWSPLDFSEEHRPSLFGKADAETCP